MANSLTITGLGVLALSLAACGPGERAAPHSESSPPAKTEAVVQIPAAPSTAPAVDPAAPATSSPQTNPKPPVTTQAQIDAEHSLEMDNCLGGGDAARGVTPAMADCINAELKMQDARLNAAYETAMARLDSASQSRLRNEERAWIRQRDERCAASATGGTIDQIAIPGCLLNETIRRRLALEAISG